MQKSPSDSSTLTAVPGNESKMQSAAATPPETPKSGTSTLGAYPSPPGPQQQQQQEEQNGSGSAATSSSRQGSQRDRRRSNNGRKDKNKRTEIVS